MLWMTGRYGKQPAQLDHGRQLAALIAAAFASVTSIPQLGTTGYDG
jgi:hypothetical protein